jgi:hypothetical protein
MAVGVLSVVLVLAVVDGLPSLDPPPPRTIARPLMILFPPSFPFAFPVVALVLTVPWDDEAAAEGVDIKREEMPPPAVVEVALAVGAAADDRKEGKPCITGRIKWAKSYVDSEAEPMYLANNLVIFRYLSKLIKTTEVEEGTGTPCCDSGS